MALNIKNLEVERLAAEVSDLTGESKTEAVRIALQERKQRLSMQGHRRKMSFDELMDYMEKNIWSKLPPSERGKRLTKEEQEEILGFGPEGY